MRNPVADTKQAIALQDALICDLNSQLAIAKSQLNDLWSIYYYHKYGIAVGTEIIVQYSDRQEKRGRICNLGDSCRFDPPWVMVNLETKDGWSKAERHTYGRWRLP
jgi:hypothetical protein